MYCSLGNLLVAWYALKFIQRTFYQIKGYGIFGSLQQLKHYIKSTAYFVFLKAPGVRGEVQRKLQVAIAGIEEKMIRKGPKVTSLPFQGLTQSEVISQLQSMSEMDHGDWENGKVSGAVYHGGSDIIQVQTEAFRLFNVSNPLHPDVFPAVRKMDAEVVGMVLSLYHAPNDGCGTTTSGGTESILMACKAYRDRALHERGVKSPEIVVPVTVHAAFDKAAQYFGIKIHHVDLDPITYKVDVKRMRRLINPNTIMLAGSAPNFPHGIMDDIVEISKLGKECKIGVHVDACLGSFIIPFLRKQNIITEDFDFRLPGVTSISCDVHKYGFTPKGTSVIMYRSSDLRKYQYSLVPKWPGGVYGSPTMAGSRPGALIAGAWATLMYMGESGYAETCMAITQSAREIEAGIRASFPELQIIGQPHGSIVAFTAKDTNIYSICDVMSGKGWSLNALQRPAALHIACTRLTATSVEKFFQDLREAVDSVRNAETGSEPEGTMR